MGLCSKFCVGCIDWAIADVRIRFVSQDFCVCRRLEWGVPTAAEFEASVAWPGGDPVDF